MLLNTVRNSEITFQLKANFKNWLLHTSHFQAIFVYFLRQQCLMKPILLNSAQRQNRFINLQQSMGRKKGVPQNIDKTKFIMKGNPFGYFKNEIVVDFKVSKKNILYKKVLDSLLFPTFNFDGNHYTPTFTIPKIQTIKTQQYEALHMQKVAESMRQFDEDQIMIPKPRSKNKYCGVCRLNYEEYKEHLQSAEHMKSLSQSIFQKHISTLCNKFQQKNVQSYMLQKIISIETKLNEDQNSTESLVEQKKQKSDQIIEIVQNF